MSTSPRTNLALVSSDASHPAKLDFPRPLGVDGPHIGDAGTIDLSVAAEPAEEHIAHALQLVRFAPLLGIDHQRVTVEAVRDRLVSAIAALDAGRYTTNGKFFHGRVV